MQTIYIITENYKQVNYRALKLLKLRNEYKIHLIVSKSQSVKTKNPDDILIRSSKNIFGIFKRIGLRKLSNKLSSLFYFPSPKILYTNKVIKFIEENLIKNKDIKPILITICPPHDMALTGLALKKKYPNLKWINDLQDLWSYDEYYFNRYNAKKKIKIKKLEMQILNNSDINVVSNEFAKDILIQKYGINSSNIKTIYHPFDRTEFNLLEAEQTISKNVISIAFVGMLFKEPKVPGEDLIFTLNKFVKQSNKKIVFNLIGSVFPEHIRKEINENLILKEYKNRPHKEAFELAAKSDYLVILLGDVPNARVIMHAKLSHYLILNKPILAFVPEDSFVANVIRKTNAGYIMKYNGNVISQLNTIFENNEKLVTNKKEIEKFELSKFLDEFKKLF